MLSSESLEVLLRIRDLEIIFIDCIYRKYYES